MITRDTSNQMIAGVCSGLARELKIDAAWIRLAFLFAFIWAGAGPLLYLILWILMPADTQERK